MESTWFIYKDGKISGPVAPSRLRELAGTGMITPSDFVRQGDVGEWVQAYGIHWLFPPVAAPGFNNLDETSPTPPPLVKHSVPCVSPHEQAVLRSRQVAALGAGVTIAVGVIGLLAYWFFSGEGTSKPEAPKRVASVAERESTPSHETSGATPNRTGVTSNGASRTPNLHEQAVVHDGLKRSHIRATRREAPAATLLPARTDSTPMPRNRELTSEQAHSDLPPVTFRPSDDESHKVLMIGHDKEVQSVSIASGGRFLASLDINGEVYVWDRERQQLLSRFKTPYRRSADSNRRNYAGVSPDGSMTLIQATKEVELKLGQVKTSTGVSRQKLTHWTPDSSSPAELRNARTGKVIASYKGGKAATFSPDSRHLIIYTDRDTLEVLGVPSGERRKSFSFPHAGLLQGANSAHYAPDGKMLFIVVGDAAEMWALTSMRMLWKLDLPSSTNVEARKNSRFVSFTPEGHSVVIKLIGQDGVVNMLRDSATGELIAKVAGHVSFDPRGGAFVCFSNDPSREILLVSTKSGNTIQTFPNPEEEGKRRYGILHYSPDGRKIAAAGERLTVFDTETWKGQDIWQEAGWRIFAMNYGDAITISLTQPPSGFRFVAVDPSTRQVIRKQRTVDASVIQDALMKYRKRAGGFAKLPDNSTIFAWPEGKDIVIFRSDGFGMWGL